ncbi:GcrA family cell cycle regulator [Mesorhizobium sp. M1163]|uniref:GcrA family cell cycle regulator n=1 Tax=Mesorhizobium sp. M1163 TaxID=2957065 RepID=UPI00333D6051
MPAEEVPHWHEDLSGAEQSARHDAWLREREILRISIPVVADALEKALEWGAYYSRGMAYILAGRSRNDTNHVVICRGQEIIWDPAIDDSGVVGPCSDGYFWFEFLVRPLEGASGMSEWSAEDLQMLRDLAGQGLSAAQIAARLPGQRSRNAVIGKLKRGKGTFGALLGQPKNHAIGRATPKTEKPVKRKYHPVRPVMAVTPASPVELLFTSPDCTHFSKPIEVVPNLPATLPITFLQAVMTDRCLHYAGAPYDPDGPDMPVCGAERAAEPLHTRYCRRHLIAKRQVAA